MWDFGRFCDVRNKGGQVQSGSTPSTLPFQFKFLVVIIEMITSKCKWQRKDISVIFLWKRPYLVGVRDNHTQLRNQDGKESHGESKMRNLFKLYRINP